MPSEMPAEEAGYCCVGSDQHIKLTRSLAKSISTNISTAGRFSVQELPSNFLKQQVPANSLLNL